LPLSQGKGPAGKSGPKVDGCRSDTEPESGGRKRPDSREAVFDGHGIGTEQRTQKTGKQGRGQGDVLIAEIILCHFFLLSCQTLNKKGIHAFLKEKKATYHKSNRKPIT
jgi:hypothetical protein